MDFVVLPGEGIHFRRSPATLGCDPSFWFFPDPVFAVAHREAEDLPFRRVNMPLRHVIVKISLRLQQGCLIPVLGWALDLILPKMLHTLVRDTLDRDKTFLFSSVPHTLHVFSGPVNLRWQAAQYIMQSNL